MKSVLTSVMLVLSSSLFATIEIDLIKITSDTEPIPSFMYVTLDKHKNIAEFGKKDLDEHGDIVSRQIFSTELDYEGVVLKKQNGRDIVIMRGHNVGPAYGGLLELDYLFNAITGSRGRFDVSLEKQGDSWAVKVDDKTVHHLHFKVHRKRFVGVVGIRRVQIVN